MATKKPRLNVTVEPTEEKFLASLAKKEQKSISSLIRELILESLERREDIALSALADERLQESDQTISHEDAWNELLKKDS
jgi:predicted DNA-binding protein